MDAPIYEASPLSRRDRKYQDELFDFFEYWFYRGSGPRTWKVGGEATSFSDSGAGDGFD